MSSRFECARVCSLVLALSAGCEERLELPADPLPDAAIAASGDAHVAPLYTWQLPEGFPEVKVPSDNPMTEAKVQLGRHLFYDKRVSGNGTQSCASCHQQSHAFADTLPRGLGSTGQLHKRSSMSLANVAYAPSLTWADPKNNELERQAQAPLFGMDPVELAAGTEVTLVQRLRALDAYQALFASAFPDDADPFSVLNIVRALASFERTLISGNSAYDRFQRGDESAMDESAQRGMRLFEDKRFECAGCHGGLLFTDQVTFVGKPTNETPFHNNALYSLDDQGAYPDGNQGVIEHTALVSDMGRFKAPTLRNIAVTAPYMHDGSIATLEQVLAHYQVGGRTVTVGDVQSVGADNPYKDKLIHGFSDATDQELADLLAFLRSLTDEPFLTDPRHADPWLN